MASPAESLDAFEEARRISRRIDHHYTIARTSDPRREWHLSEANRLEPLLASLTRKALS